MSLFKVQDLWSTQCCDDGIESSIFNATSLTVGTVGEFETEIIVISNYTGCLRMYCPSRDNLELGYLSDDCLLEVVLGHPVMQTCIGKYVSGSPITYLASLHPQSISIYNLHIIPGTTKHGNEAQLQLIQDYRLSKSGACRFISGPFGLNRYHDCFAVTYLDGSLEFLDQSESVAVTLPEILLPVPLLYVATCDSFVLQTDNAILECYRYQNLISKKPSLSWSLNMGESNMSLYPISLSMSSLIVCVGERMLSIVHENGFAVTAKRVQYATQCAHAYNHPLPHDQDNFMIIIISDTNTLLLYDKYLTLTWSASLLRTPISVQLYNTTHQSGILLYFSMINT
ncbi:hypothetical protein WDU94_003451 [Cyamophila willieti]